MSERSPISHERRPRRRVRRAKVYDNHVLAGLLEETVDGYRFTYDPTRLADPLAAPISMSLPKRARPYESPFLFAFFQGLLAEGALKELQCRILKIDENDHFGRLVETAGYDTIGSVTVVPDDEEL